MFRSPFKSPTRAVIRTAAAQAGGGGGAPDPWATIWAGQPHIYDLKAANVTLAADKLQVAANLGSADAMFKLNGADSLTYTEDDADFNGLPSIAAGGAALIARNEADSAFLTDTDFISASAGFWSQLVRLTEETGETTDAFEDIPGIALFAYSTTHAISYAGADQQVVAAAYGSSGGQRILSAALARNTTALVTWVKTATHLQLYINTTLADEVACPDLLFFGGAVYVGRSRGGDRPDGKIGPWAAGDSVPADLADRLAAACTLAGIS